MFTIKSKTNLKTVTKSVLTTLIVFSLTSCESEEVSSRHVENNKAATFTSTISNPLKELSHTRAAGTTWHAGDQIGIYAIESLQELSDESIYNNYSNHKYINQAAGEVANFNAVGDEILFPHTDQKIDFIAYYPYTTDITNFTFPVDVSVQEPQSNIDIMYATAKEHSSENPNVELKFSHMLSQLQLKLTSNEEVSLQDALVTIKNAHTNAIFNMADGTITTDTIIKTVTPIIVFDSEINELTAKAILLPGQDLSNINIEVQLNNGYIYNWTPTQYTLTPQTTRVYKFNITKEDVELIHSGSTINDWELDTDETVHNLKPTPNDSSGNPEDPDSTDPEATDKGTEANPYTVSEAIAATSGYAWVEGYILGYATKEGTTDRVINTDPNQPNSETNIVLTDDITVVEPELIFPIILNSSNPESPHYIALNLKDNYHLIGQKVRIYCNISYYRGGVGGIDISDYSII